MQETRVQSLDQEDPLEKEIATHSSVLAWRIPWTEDSLVCYLMNASPQPSITKQAQQWGPLHWVEGDLHH